MLSDDQIEKLANRKGVKRIAVENFLYSIGDLSYGESIQNLNLDSRLYKWNAATRNAISAGIKRYFS